jgi:protein-L-isoaspartate O-methyltransferase
MAPFFERHPRFLETSHVGAWPARLNLRHVAIIESNRDLISGSRVLDLASHDGRWSMAALDAGAAHVTGVEARPELLAAAEKTLAHYGVAPDRFTFAQRDLNHALQAPGAYDVVLCLGYFYHTLNHLALWEYIASTGAEHAILDGMVEPGDAQVIRVYDEAVSEHANGVTEAGVLNGRVLVGHPTKPVLAKMLRHFGYRTTFFDWERLLRERQVAFDPSRPHDENNPVGDYARGARATALAKRL